MIDVAFGWKKDKYDPHDFLHVRRIVKVPESTILSDYLTSIRNQGSVGSCVGHSAGFNVNSVLKKLGLFTEWQSPTWYYNGARFIEGWLNIDSGCFPKDAFDWAVKNGTLLEHFWPYDASKFDSSAPSSERIAKAVKYPNFAYYRCVDGVDGLVSALAEGHFVSIGGPWFSKWNNAPNGVLSQVTKDDTVYGGHETCLYGYDLSKEIFYGANSWGTDWGNNGFYTMPFSAIPVFKELGGYDGHYVTFDSNDNVSHIIVAESNINGSITPSGVINVINGESQTFTMTPNENCRLTSLKIDGINIPLSLTYTFENVIEAHSIKADFSSKSDCKYGAGIASTLNKIQQIRGRKGRFFYLNP